MELKYILSTAQFKIASYSIFCNCILIVNYTIELNPCVGFKLDTKECFNGSSIKAEHFLYIFLF